ncbi:hypothetical protein [Kitasatospora sp. KL5]|uniref:hypothetical protein n=1 Tax=Kitasatospora sp. KL5 TaxID=3425125 RepID=UPI003D6EA7A5
MGRVGRTVAVGCAIGSLVLVTATPAASAERRSSNACTHDWSGPQVCIEIEGHDDWASRLRVRWIDPPSGKDAAEAILHEGDEQREVHIRMPGRRQGKEIVAEWTDIRLSWGKVCGSFAGLNAWACQDVYGK